MGPSMVEYLAPIGSIGGEGEAGAVVAKDVGGEGEGAGGEREVSRLEDLLGHGGGRDHEDGNRAESERQEGAMAKGHVVEPSVRGASARDDEVVEVTDERERTRGRGQRQWHCGLVPQLMFGRRRRRRRRRRSCHS